VNRQDSSTNSAQRSTVVSRKPSGQVKMLLLSVVRQDRKTLELQLASKQLAGTESYTSTKLDIMRPHILRLLRGSATKPDGDSPIAERQAQLLI
jgi:hypothetical protein